MGSVVSDEGEFMVFGMVAQTDEGECRDLCSTGIASGLHHPLCKMQPPDDGSVVGVPKRIKI